jgi:type III secretion protein R
MFQISPITVALPFKLLLFVLVDGWHLIARGLILGYT